MRSDALETIIYTGLSMNPAFKPADIVYFLPCSNKRSIKSGDVIIFRHPEKNNHIIHRVISIKCERIRTQGDNSPSADPWTLNAKEIIGLAIKGKRGNSEFSIRGGKAGLIYAFCVKVVRAIVRNIFRILHPFYRAIALTGIFRRVLPARLKPRMIRLSRPSGTELQFVMGRRVIGRLVPGKSEWDIRRPFRIFVDMTHIPYCK